MSKSTSAYQEALKLEDKDIEAKVDQLRKELFELRFARKSDQTDTTVARKIKRQIAQYLTALNSKRSDAQ